MNNIKIQSYHLSDCLASQDIVKCCALNTLLLLLEIIVATNYYATFLHSLLLKFNLNVTLTTW